MNEYDMNLRDLEKLMQKQGGNYNFAMAKNQ